MNEFTQSCMKIMNAVDTLPASKSVIITNPTKPLTLKLISPSEITINKDHIKGPIAVIDNELKISTLNTSVLRE
jgi:hypothetical protein